MNMENSLSGEKASESRLPDDRDMKKVWFKRGEGVGGDDMIWEENRSDRSGSANEIDLMEGDVKKSIINGILTIEFSNRIQ
ncbi:hypothetical protein Godav_023239 [Gossypium davidsonii]|uniref:Uncharacterized protein n=2 Tax=Gossypium TaxID=3633 RepID=A0A7J8SQY8_GOSDV|nr:hypothetical protein [Gossypium davidsonii]MBA0664239.1 hypothetical protein [Gossypium klotzschianum]